MLNLLKKSIASFVYLICYGRLISVCLALLINYNVSYCKPYYVSTTGKDTNNGLTPENAWRTVTYAATKATAGDIVYIKAGLYQGEAVVIKNSGTKNAPVVFQGYQIKPGDTPALNYKPGDALNHEILPVLVGITGRDGIGINNKSYFEIRNVGLTKCYNGIFPYNAHHFIIENVFLDKIGFGAAEYGEGIFPSLSHDFTIRNCVVTDAGMSNIIAFRSYNSTIENCKSYAVAYTQNATDYHIVVKDGQNITVRNCQAYNLHSYNGGHPGHGIGIKDSYRGGYPYPHSTNNKIINCATYDMGEYFFVAHEAHQNEFVNCSAKGHYDTPSQNYWSEGINIRDGAHNNTFRFCTVEGVRTSIAFQNTVEGPVNPDGSAATQTCYNNTVANCLFLNSSKAIEMWNANKNLITNCVFDGAGNSAFIRFLYSVKNLDNLCYNSILLNVKGKFKSDDGGSGSTIIFNYSNFWKNNFSMQTGEGNMEKDPLFVDQANRDYHLKSMEGHWDINSSTWVADQETSPCIDAGRPIDNFSNEPNPNGNVIDIGLFGGTSEASKSNSISLDERFTIYPNPFKNHTTIIYTPLTECHLNIQLFDGMGKQVRNLCDTKVLPGFFSIQWDGTNSHGQPVSKGFYLFKMITDSGKVFTKKIIFL